MSVLIKGLKMPKEETILLVLCPDGEVWIEAEEEPFPGEAEAIELPPHGRLIDADAMMKLEVIPSDNWVFRAIEKAPTIIEAEE